VKPANGAIKRKRERSSAASKVLKDEQTLADAEHTIAETDQTLVNADQTSADTASVEAATRAFARCTRASVAGAHAHSGGLVCSHARCSLCTPAS